MGKVVLGMTISLDGYINDRDGSVASLYPDLDGLRNTKPLQESIQNTGAVVMGRNSYAMAEDPDWFAGNYEYQVPIDRKSTRLNSSHQLISYAVFCLKKKKK